MFNVNKKGIALRVGLWPDYVWNPWIDARQMPGWLKECGIDPDKIVKVDYRASVQLLELEPPMLVRRSSRLDWEKVDYERVEAAGHFVYIEDPKKERLLEWLRLHSYIE